MDLEIAIPSYNRPYKLKSTTLNLLASIPTEYIKIYVEDEEQYLIYREALGWTYDLIITNTEGIGQKRNYIKENTPAKYLFQIDDDIYAIKEWNGISLSSEAIYELIKEGFKECEEHGLRLWGICAYANYFFMKNKNSTNLKFICGNFHGTIMTGEKILTPINTLEDYFNTCEHYLSDGGVLRLNGYGTKTKFASESGGLQSFLTTQQRQDEEVKNAFYLLNKFGKEMLRIIKKQRGLDIRLNHRFIQL